MNRRQFLFSAALAAKTPSPNVLLIMTDDSGFGVPSTFGGVIPTPALDRIAMNTQMDALSDCQLVVEAATENEAVKREILRKLCPHLKTTWLKPGMSCQLAKQPCL